MRTATIELLAPARDLACAVAAIDHGADAVYVGAERFGARQAAGNSVDDIARLCAYAHPFGVRVYVTLNTLIYNDELEQTERLAWELYRAGVDAFIVQDMALLSMNLPPVPLHASTQMDNRSPEKVQWLRSRGFRQVVLARELSLAEISAVHEAAPDVVIEAFVHGALCVSLSGRCMASQFCFQRSANRGACAQFCRLPFSLVDADGHELVRDRHLLSLRDMNRSDLLEEMMDAGVRSFKIEGRLKDVSYVKNVTAYYRQQIDRILQHRPDFRRSSWGRVELNFTPDLTQSFSRGYTDYFLRGRTLPLASMDSPKSRGQEVGVVKEVRGGCLVVAGTATFCNGDGLCFLDAQGQMQGFRVNRAEGNHLYPAKMPPVKKGDTLWRSYSHQWESLMAGQTASRSISLVWTIAETADGFSLSARREDGAEVECSFPQEHQLARSSQDESIRSVLTKLGDTCYCADKVDIRFSQSWFIPRSLLAQWRRKVLDELSALPLPGTSETADDSATSSVPADDSATSSATCHEEWAFNVSNRLAQSFYAAEGCSNIQPALEVSPAKPGESARLMTCRYCIRHELGLCPKQSKERQNIREPLYLLSRDGRRFRLAFDCRRCQMSVLSQ